ncbi:MAG: ABC transporter permease [Cyclobacteriaceae bacterium]|nr:ABC transporter permease [Cyclobacteriaceae bacterium]
MSKIIIDANKKSISLGIKELIAYRDLFYTLAWRDLRVRYAQTALGLIWALIQPLATLLIFTLIFGRAIKVETGDVPYPVYALSGMLAWSYFAYVLGQSGQSVIGAQEMVKKVYFPRLVIPLSKAVTGLVDFLVALVFLIILMGYFRIVPSAGIVYLPLFFIMNVMAALGAGIWLSALTVRYRDFQHVVPFLVQVGLYATPIAYPVNMIPENYQWLYHLNPMAGVVEGYRWSILGGEGLSVYSWLSLGIIFVLFFTGLVYFKSVEKIMADVV